MSQRGFKLTDDGFTIPLLVLSPDDYSLHLFLIVLVVFIVLLLQDGEFFRTHFIELQVAKPQNKARVCRPA